MPKPSTYRLPPELRLLGLLVNLLLGGIPSIAFFIWIERSCALPYLGRELNWPWVGLEALPTLTRAGWDFALFLLFGALHSLAAQPFFHKIMERVFPPQCLRTVYLAITGAAVFLVMALWQSTGVVVWALPLAQKWNILISLVLFWGFLAGVLVVMTRFDALDFIGFRQLYKSKGELTQTSGNSELIQTGLYGVVRHPIYTFTLLAVFVTPFMTLDRLLLGAAMVLYLIVAIPIEERKLLAQFGQAYERYRMHVPAVIPAWHSPKKG